MHVLDGHLFTVKGYIAVSTQSYVPNLFMAISYFYGKYSKCIRPIS